MPICIKCKKDKKYGVSIDKNCDFGFCVIFEG